MGEFHSASLTHFIVLCMLALITATVVRYGRAAKNRDAIFACRYDRTLAIAVAMLWGISRIQCWMPGHFRWDRSLPLHICALTGLLAPIALWTGRRTPRVMLYFWGFGLCTQAFITPNLFIGPAHFDFWTFWGCHIAIVVAAVYDYTVRDYRPTCRDLYTALFIMGVYVLIVLPVDIRLGVNYGYLGKTDFAQPAIILSLGQWPERVPRGVALSWAAMAFMFPIGSWRQIRKSPTDSMPDLASGNEVFA